MIHGIPDKQFVERLTGSSLVTARIFYHMPDHLSLLQEYIWQELDVAPKFPKLFEFLDFWDRTLEGPIKEVEVVHAKLLTPADIRGMKRSEFRLN